jgi:PhzF family phenazine biosynthesis protein
MATAVVLGLGKMGSAMALRLRDHGHAVSIWNRSIGKAHAVSSEDLAGHCTVHASPLEAVGASSAESAVLLSLASTQACLDVIGQIHSSLRNRTVVNLTSGNPDEARQIATALSAPELGVKAYVDGAYCGPPKSVRAGTGVLFLSSSNKADVERLRPMLSLLGEAVFCGGLGSSRAIDYAVVDMALVCYKSFISNVEMVEREGGDFGRLYEHVGKRLATVPAALEGLHARMKDRSDEGYVANQVVSLETLHGFWSSRLPYFDAHGIPADFAVFMASLCERAAGGPAGAHWGADVARLQESMRPANGGGPAEDGAKVSAALRPSIVAGLGGAVGLAAAGGEVEFQVVDVFSPDRYGGNPTCVCVLPTSGPPPSDHWMGLVARETRQPTTSFVDETSRSYRTFGANGIELPLLSGHSSLGVAAVLTARTGARIHDLTTKYGPVTICHDGQVYELSLPAATGPLIQPTPLAPLAAALGVDEASVLAHGSFLDGNFFFVELRAEALSQLTPDIAAIAALSCSCGLIAMAQGMVTQHRGFVPGCINDGIRCEVDFTCRNFVPKLGIDEDVATGSIQVPLNAYWSKKLGMSPGAPVMCLQASRRGGFIRSRSPGDGHVYVAGHAAMSLRGTVRLEEHEQC